MTRDAVLSDCGTYRYRLRRTWGPSRRSLIIVMLNPSLADATIDDQTIRRCVSYARREDCGRLLVVNLYALRSPYPKTLWQHPDPVGPDNDEHLNDVLSTARRADLPVLVAWGFHARPDRIARFIEIAGDVDLRCLGTTAAGAPRHPSRMSSTAPLRPWRPPR